MKIFGIRAPLCKCGNSLKVSKISGNYLCKKCNTMYYRTGINRRGKEIK